MDKINNKNIMIEKNLNGSLVLRYNDFKRVYYGFSQKDALRLFKSIIQMAITRSNIKW